MTEIKTYIEKVFKEYLLLKNYILTEAKNIEEIKKEFAKASLDNLNADDYFEKVGWIALMQEDLFLQKAKLFFTMEAYKDIIEPPKELTDQIKKELEDVSFEQMFSIIDGERKTINKDKYEARKKEYFIQVDNLKKQLNGTEAS
jgi:hypothetical protein